MNDYSEARYQAERNSETRTYARDHSYAEWCWQKRWEAAHGIDLLKESVPIKEAELE